MALTLHSFLSPFYCHFHSSLFFASRFFISSFVCLFSVSTRYIFCTLRNTFCSHSPLYSLLFFAIYHLYLLLFQFSPSFTVHLCFPFLILLLLLLPLNFFLLSLPLPFLFLFYIFCPVFPCIYSPRPLLFIFLFLSILTTCFYVFFPSYFPANLQSYSSFYLFFAVSLCIYSP